MERAVYRWTDEDLKEKVNQAVRHHEDGGFQDFVRELNEEILEENNALFARIIDGKGKLIAELIPATITVAPINGRLMEDAQKGRQISDTVKLETNRSVHILYSPLADGMTIQIGLFLEKDEIWMQEFKRVTWRVAFLSLVFSVCAGLFLSRRALSPVREMAQTATKISGRSLGVKMPISGRRDELDQLAEAFNGMLARIDTLVNGLREVTETLAHDLRTPLTGIRGLVEITLREPRSAQIYQLTMSQILE